jgi:tetratricopeptide (TPR) repeat protein
MTTSDPPSKKPTAKAQRYAAGQNETGLQYYATWEIDKAIEAFRETVAADPENPEYHLNLARAYARGSNFQEAIRSLGEYLRTETNEDIAARYERLFSSALDEVETELIEKTRAMGMPIQQTGKAIQMWLEYRITLGRRPLRVPKPELWAAALTYAVGKVNFSPVTRVEVADLYGVSERSLKQKYEELVQTLDLMPADFRYFTGKENPLDKLVEAAQMLDELYGRFRDED